MRFKGQRFVFLLVLCLTLPVLVSCKTITVFDDSKREARVVEDALSENEKDELKKLADQGDVDAQTRLGNTETNEALALKWYCQAARQGEGEAQYKVGQLYSELAPLTPVKTGRLKLAAAMMWLDVSIINGQKEASALRKKLGKSADSMDFKLYSEFSRMGINAPCELHEVEAPRLGIVKRPIVNIEEEEYDE